jgi:hypothetical protein
VTVGHKTDIIIIIALDSVLQVWIQYNVYVVCLYICPYLSLLCESGGEGCAFMV